MEAQIGTREAHPGATGNGAARSCGINGNTHCHHPHAVGILRNIPYRAPQLE
jgi:hypothetical protein